MSRVIPRAVGAVAVKLSKWLPSDFKNHLSTCAVCSEGACWRCHDALQLSSVKTRAEQLGMLNKLGKLHAANYSFESLNAYLGL